MDDQALVELVDTHEVDVSVKDTSGDEESLFFVIFLLMKIIYFLDPEGSQDLSHANLGLLGKGGSDLLAETWLLLVSLEVVPDGKPFFH